MKIYLLALAIVFVSETTSSLLDAQLDGDWRDYKQLHGKKYTPAQEVVRRLRWETNLKYIKKHNDEAEAGVHTFKLGMNKYGDMSNREFRRQLNGHSKRPSKVDDAERTLHKSLNASLPASVDWRTNGSVTPVKDQGQCGSCWAFSATGSLEGQHFKKTGELVSLSEQNLVDCSWRQGNQGCNGGLMDQAFQYIKVNKGINSEASYPYEAQAKRCRFKSQNVSATVTGFVDIESGNETDLTDAIANVGPISVAIDASKTSFQLYKSGVYYEPACSSTQLDHGVLAIGYGIEGDQEYYIVKNSWGTSWGDNGYILMSRNRNNNCGIATQASYPTV